MWSQCEACGACVSACPVDALGLYGREVSVGDVMSIVERDRVYYTASGGGLTVSGGEPTVQLTFCLALLRAARGAGIKTCVETCGYSPRDAYEAILPFTDLFLFDYKATGSEKHRQLTGVPSDRILENLRWLRGAGAAIVLRCPLVPEVNDTDDHFEAIVRLLDETPRLQGVELLPYHDWGNHKYREIGELLPRLATFVPSADRQRQWNETLDAKCAGLLPATASGLRKIR